jgi:peptidoglycan/xylan/chitin deacetylase (PgdA/CDA1 family)
MYHGISESTTSRHPYFETNTSSLAFAQQMQYLHEEGYKTTDLKGAIAAIQQGDSHDRWVVITFDDGYQSFYVHALPELLRYGFTATMFIVPTFASSSALGETLREYMTWNEVREIRKQGISIGSHTVSHPELNALAPEQIRHEIIISKEIIEYEIGSQVQSFSYPYAFPEHDQRAITLVREALQSAGYENGVSTMIGTANSRDDRFFLPRLPVNCYDDRQLFQTKLEGGYDWLHTPQRAYKGLRIQKRSLAKLIRPAAY